MASSRAISRVLASAVRAPAIAGSYSPLKARFVTFVGGSKAAAGWNPCAARASAGVVAVLPRSMKDHVPAPSTRAIYEQVQQISRGSLLGSRIFFQQPSPAASSPASSPAAPYARNFSTAKSATAAVVGGEAAAATSSVASSAATEAASAPLSAFSPAEVPVMGLVDPSPTGWWPSNIMEAIFVSVHDMTGASWFYTIVATTVAIRMFLLPVIITQMRNMSRLAWIKDEMELITKQYKAHGGVRAPPQMYDKMNEQMNALYKKHDCSPMKSVIAMMFQAPIMISVFLSLRKMAGTYPSMMTGGAYWFTDLTVCDPYYILPITAGCLTFLTLELGTETGQSLAQSAGNMKNYMRVAAFAVIPITVVAGFPNAVLIYWVTQASVSLVQSVFFRIPGVKPALGIVPAPPPKKEVVVDAAPAAPVIPVWEGSAAAAGPGAGAAAAPGGAPVVHAKRPPKAKGAGKKRSHSTSAAGVIAGRRTFSTHAVRGMPGGALRFKGAGAWAGSAVRGA